MARPAVNVVWKAAQYLGINSAFRVLEHRRLLVLNYHAVVSDEYARDPLLYTNVTGVTQFSQQMAELARRFHPVSVSDLRDWQAARGRLHRNPVLVTFDDGYRNNLTYAASVLERFGIPAVINVCTGYIGKNRILWPDEIYWRVLFWPERFIPLPVPGRQQEIPADRHARIALAGHLRESCKRLPVTRLSEYIAQLRRFQIPEPVSEVYGFLSWDEVRALKSRGFEIGSHTVEHMILTSLASEDLARELTDSKRAIEQQLGSKCVCFAYTNGGRDDVSQAVVDQVQRAEYSFAFTVMGGLASPDDNPLMLDRVYVSSGTLAEFRCRISGFHDALKRCLASHTVPQYGAVV